MDNPLTPGKIQRLMKYAEDKSFSLPRRIMLGEMSMDPNSLCPQATVNKYESSSGILDLDQIEALGESGIGNLSLKSTAFNPGEITGRSTGTDDINSKSLPLKPEEYGRHSLMALDSIQSQMDKQTSEVNDIMRHSIASNYSFHSKRDLTADEASLVMREAPIPVQHSTQAFQDTMMSINASNMSVGTYFKNRCPEFGRILAKTDSPDRSAMQPSISEVSIGTDQMENMYKVDCTLDSVPVKQSAKESLHPPINTTFNKQMDVSNYSAKEILQDISAIPKVRENTRDNASHFKPIQNYSTPAKQEVHFAVPKPFGPGIKATDILLKNLQSSLRPSTEDTEGSVDNSLSISKIADYLGKQSNVSVTEMLYLNNQRKQAQSKQPLAEKQMNIPDKNKPVIQVTHLIDTKNIDSASSSGSVNTVISMNKLKNEQENRQVPSFVISNLTNEASPISSDVEKTSIQTRSKSPSSKSRSTLSTVHENFASFQSGPDSPLQSTGDTNTTKYIPSPNLEYEELDKSVDWPKLLERKHQRQGLAKEQWAVILTTPVKGFVGVPCPVSIKVTTITDSWLTAKFQFVNLPNDGRNLAVELPRLPLLLSPGKSEIMSIHITSNAEMDTALRFKISLKDASIDSEIEQTGEIPFQMILPTIQAMTSEGLNKLIFPPLQEKSSTTKSFILISDCPDNLQIVLSVTEGESMFFIKNVQEIKRDDVNKVLLMDRQGCVEESQKTRSKVMNKQLCRLSSGNAMKVTICFTAPNLVDLNSRENTATLKGCLQVNLMDVSTVLRVVDLIGVIGVPCLVLENCGSKLKVGPEPTIIKLRNTGSIAGSWVVKLRALTGSERNVPLKISPCKFDVGPAGSVDVSVTHAGFESCEMTIYFEEVTTSQKTSVDLYAICEAPKSFPIKTNVPSLSWVRAGRKEISLKNYSDRKVQIRCQIKGEGFSLDLPGLETRGVYSLPFLPNECRVLSVVFAPNSVAPQVGSLHLVFDKNSDFSRKIMLHGCASGEFPRWSGLATYGDTALVRAVVRSPIELRLHNKANTPAFVCASINFNLQYMCVAQQSRLLGGRHIIPGRALHTLSLLLEWPRVERRAKQVTVTALATLSVLTGSEFTRQRIMRILRNERTGEIDRSSLPPHLRQLTETFEGQDKSIDHYFKDFSEPKSSLAELINGIHELNAQIDLPQDFSDDNTIVINDDTVIEHHTLCD